MPYWITRAIRKGLAEDPDERHGDMRELLRALKDEPPDDDGSIAEPDGDDDSIEHEGRVLHAPATAPQRGRWPWITLVVFLSTLVAVLGSIALRRSPTPEPEPPPAEAVAPYHVILGLVTDDEFADAEDYWRDHIAEVSDAEALKLARACLARAEQLVEPADRAKAAAAALAAGNMADHVHRFGKTDELREEGGQLRAEAVSPARSHRPTAE